MALRRVAGPMATTAFVLLDAVPGMKEQVFRSLDKLAGKGLVSKEQVRVGSFDILVKVQAADADKLEDWVSTNLRFIGGVVNLRMVKDPATEDPQVRAAMQRMR